MKSSFTENQQALQHYYRRFVTLIARRCQVKCFKNQFAFIFADMFNSDVGTFQTSIKLHSSVIQT